MSKQWFRANVIVVAALAAAMCGSAAASAGVPATINYQGFLTDQKTGVPVNASVSVTFTLYDAASGGAVLYSETQSLTATNGVINAQIGRVAPFPATLAFDKPYWLEIKVGSDTLAPRQAVTSSAYAQVANGIGSFGGGNTRAGDGALRSLTTGSLNTAVGENALYSNTTGEQNDAFGQSALRNTTTGSQNAASGQGALQSNTTGNHNAAFGQGALASNTTGNQNAASGQGALQSNTTGTLNAAFGQAALSSNTTGNQNAASGQGALQSNTTGSYNAAFGQGALFSNTTGFGNTAAGYDALYSNTSGLFNVASGSQALFSNTTGSNNTALGQDALNANTTGPNNTATGQGALQANTTGSGNTATGQGALQSNIGGCCNTAIGMGALLSNTYGASNTATGWNALHSNTRGNYNAAGGYGALQSNTTGGSNTANGWSALMANTTGYTNTATGESALASNTTGFDNTASGSAALNSNTTGSSNTALGVAALGSLKAGNDNIGIGWRSGRAVVGGNLNIDIGNEGVASDDGIIRIGDAMISKGAFLHGIQGVVPAKDDGMPVVVSSEGQLGNVPNITLTSAGLGFGSTTRQMLNLWGTGYGIGVQNNMLYARTASGFGWYQGGVHSDAWNDPGAGGRRLMGLSEQGLRVVGSDPAGGNDITLLADGSIHAKVVNTTSDRNSKENFSEVDAREVLARVVGLPLQTWNYRSDELKVKHVGPVAQDFHAAFNVGADDKHIATVDADGVALAAIQGLYHLVEDKDAALSAFRERLAAQEETIARLDADRDALQARVESVEQETRAQFAQLRRALGTLQQQAAQPLPAVLSH
jgi:hypothetical protein